MQDRRTLPGHRGYLGLGAASQTVDAYFKTVLILNGLRGWEHLFWRQSLRVPAVPLGSGIAQPRHNTTQHDTTRHNTHLPRSGISKMDASSGRAVASSFSVAPELICKIHTSLCLSSLDNRQLFWPIMRCLAAENLCDSKT